MMEGSLPCGCREASSFFAEKRERVALPECMDDDNTQVVPPYVKSLQGEAENRHFTYLFSSSGDATNMVGVIIGITFFKH